MYLYFSSTHCTFTVIIVLNSLCYVSVLYYFCITPVLELFLLKLQPSYALKKVMLVY